MSTELAPQAMNREEAQECVEHIRAGMEQIRLQVLALYEREGWRALGHGSWRACVAAEFGRSERHLYRILDAAMVDRVLTHGSNEEVMVPERQARELVPLLGAPEAMGKVWRQVQVVAVDQGRPVTALDVRVAVREEITTMAHESHTSLSAASADWSPGLRKAMTQEMCRQRGELGRLVHHLVALGDGDPEAFIRLHNGHIPNTTIAEVAAAQNWLRAFRECWKAHGVTVDGEELTPGQGWPVLGPDWDGADLDG